MRLWVKIALGLLGSLVALTVLGFILGPGEERKSKKSATITAAAPPPRRHTTKPRQARAPTPQPAPRKRPAPRPKPSAKPHFDAKEQRAYDESKDACGLFPISEVAKEYGGDPSSPVTVAQALAAKSYRGRFQAPAREGCLAGLK